MVDYINATNGEDAAIIDPDQQQAITNTTRKLVEMFEQTSRKRQ